MTVIDARRKVTERITSALALRAMGESEALGMALSLLKYELDDLETVARAEGEAEGKRKAMEACDVILAQAGCGHA